MVGWDLWRSSSPVPSQAESPREPGVTQEHVQVGLEHLQRGRHHYLPGQPVPVFCHLHVEVKLLVFYFMAIALCSVSGHHWKGSGTILLTPIFEVLIWMNGSPFSFSSFYKVVWKIVRRYWPESVFQFLNFCPGTFRRNHSLGFMILEFKFSEIKWVMFSDLMGSGVKFDWEPVSQLDKIFIWYEFTSYFHLPLSHKKTLNKQAKYGNCH